MGRKRVVVVGGGISGLAAAHRLIELNPELELALYEAGPRAGGVLHTVRRDGFLIEQSADNFIASVPWGVDLCRRLQLDERLIPTTAGHQRGALVVRQGRLLRVPEGFMLLAPARLWPLVTTPLLSPWGKLRLLAEYFVPARPGGGDESLASFASRRLGRETFERIVQPLVGGIYTADPDRLSLQATLPRFLEMERRYGSLIRAARALSPAADEATSAGARYGLFVAPRDGLSTVVEALVARLPADSLHLQCPIERIVPREGGGWRLTVEPRDAQPAETDCDAVIVAAPAPAAGAMLAACDPALAADLARIEYAGTSIVSLAFRRDQIANPLDGFGFVVPAGEGRRILAGSFASIKFAGRAPEGMVLVRVFIGGACQAELAELPDDALRQVAVEELAELLGTRGEPAFALVARWPKSMPQYHLGHCERIAAIERRVAVRPTLALAGNAYHGVGIPHCIHSGELAAERVVAALASD